MTPSPFQCWHPIWMPPYCDLRAASVKTNRFSSSTISDAVHMYVASAPPSQPFMPNDVPRVGIDRDRCMRTARAALSFIFRTSNLGEALFQWRESHSSQCFSLPELFTHSRVVWRGHLKGVPCLKQSLFRPFPQYISCSGPLITEVRAVNKSQLNLVNWPKSWTKGNWTKFSWWSRTLNSSKFMNKQLPKNLIH